jgi:hypothetical protein
MTTGALIFARNNEHIDYVAMAQWSAKNIQRHLGIDTHIITDDTRSDASQRHFADAGTVTWHNTNRMDAYALSPWDRTLVLDADYVVASDQLKVILAADEDFLCHDQAYDVTELNDFKGLNYFGRFGMPMWWATVMMFRRSHKAEIIFDCMAMIRDNWTHYTTMYGTGQSVYRNDHALSIAINIENGHTMQSTSIPWSLASLTPEHTLTQVSQDRYRVDFVTPEQRPRWISLQGQDFHAMGKKHLGEIVASSS